MGDGRRVGEVMLEADLLGADALALGLIEEVAGVLMKEVEAGQGACESAVGGALLDEAVGVFSAQGERVAQVQVGVLAQGVDHQVHITALTGEGVPGVVHLLKEVIFKCLIETRAELLGGCGCMDVQAVVDVGAEARSGLRGQMRELLAGRVEQGAGRGEDRVEALVGVGACGSVCRGGRAQATQRLARQAIGEVVAGALGGEVDLDAAEGGEEVVVVEALGGVAQPGVFAEFVTDLQGDKVVGLADGVVEAEYGAGGDAAVDEDLRDAAVGRRHRLDPPAQIVDRFEDGGFFGDVGPGVFAAEGVGRVGRPDDGDDGQGAIEALSAGVEQGAVGAYELLVDGS